MDAQASHATQAGGGFLRFFRNLPDPRARNVVHRFSDILTIAICAVVCGARGWVDVELFGQSKLPWLRTFLSLPNGIPSHDTFGRVFAALDPDAFEHCFMSWIATLGSQGQRHLAIDGKSIRRSFEHGWDKSGMVHLVSAFAAEQGLCFAQLAAEGKGNELEAMRRLIELLDLEEAVVSIDAAGCQRDIARRLIEKKADYVLAVKENQPLLHQKVKGLLDEAVLEGFAGLRHDYLETVDGDHGRIETRRVWMSSELAGSLPEDLLTQWAGLSSLIVVHGERDVDGKVGAERRYFISSLDRDDAARAGKLVRGHWLVENQLHWQLDVSFDEDQRRLRKDHSAENFSRLTRMALNLLKADKTTKAGVKGRRLKAGWDEPYLLKLLTG